MTDEELIALADRLDAFYTSDDQYWHIDHPICNEAAAAIRALVAEVSAWRECALYDATMEGPVFKGWDRSALERCRALVAERGK